MEIIKYNICADNTDLPKRLLRSIAFMMFNKEMNKRIYTREGKIDNPEADNNVVIHEGITYSISHSIGNIIFLVPNGLILNIEKIRNTLKKELKEIYKNYEKHNTVILYNRNSTVFVHVETKTPHNSITRYIGNTIKYPSVTITNVMFKWYDDRTCLCENGQPCAPVNNKNYFNDDFLLQSNVSHYTNSIIVDLNNIFNLEGKIYPSPAVEDFTMSQFLASKNVITYEINRVCHIDTMLRKIHDNNINYKGAVMYSIFNIYEEKWENIKPMRVTKISNNVDKLDIVINKVIIFNCSFEEEELDIKKDNKIGIKMLPNDICHICYMLLYDTIYVLEFNVSYTKHVCICALCLHSNYIKIKKQLTDYKKKSSCGYNILKIIYPRTCYDLINNTNIDPSYKELLCELAYSNATFINDTIQTNNYIGITNIHNLLYKNLNIEYEDKTFFLYTY